MDLHLTTPSCIVWSKEAPVCLALREQLVTGLRQAGVGTLELFDMPPEGSNDPLIFIVDALDLDSCSVIRQASQNGVSRLLAIITQNINEIEDAWKALEMGASDVLFWDETPDPADVVRARLQRWQEVDSLLTSREVSSMLVGESPLWLAVMRQVVEAARFSDAPILLTGESGTGKELVAHLVHRLSRRRSQHDLIVVDCTTIVPDLSGSELFGHERGAYTGAVNPRDGAFALANHGTLFLDEVGELPAVLQMQLLRVLQEHTFKRVGSNNWQKTDFRLLCATNRTLPAKESIQGGFRSDLYYRISSWQFHLPPLRERREDILPLAQHFLSQALPPGTSVPLIDDRVEEYLQRRDYPGNIRDLRNLVFRIAARHVGPGPISIGDIPVDERPNNHPEYNENNGKQNGMLHLAARRAIEHGYNLKEISNLFREAAMREAVDQERGNLQRAASRLGVSDRLLQKWKAGKLE
jgi:DNA-binding NtrC family response regulator